jgi:hypothetical protein
MSTNRFTPEKHYDFCIIDDAGSVVGHVRVKPSGIHWAPKNSKKWYGVPLDRFAQWIEAQGKRKSK